MIDSLMMKGRNMCQGHCESSMSQELEMLEEQFDFQELSATNPTSIRELSILSSKTHFMAWIMRIRMPTFKPSLSVVPPLKSLAQQLITLDLLYFLSHLGIKPRNG